CAGESLRKRGVTRFALVVALAWALMTGGRMPLVQAQTAPPAQAPALPGNEGSCFGSVIAQIQFPGVAGADLQALRGLTRIHEGDKLERGMLSQALRALFATGKFADLRAECERQSDGRALVSFVTTANFFVGHIAVVGAPPRPTESQIVNASK